MKAVRDMRSLASILGVALIFVFWPHPAALGISHDTYCSVPPFVNTSVSPNVLIVLDNSGSMNDEAYPGTYDPAKFSSGKYYGYFDSEKNYVYSGNGRWEVTTLPVENGTVSNPVASGDFLNWATMRRIDASKKLLIGGKASPREPNSGVTVKLLGENSPWSYNFQKDFDNSPHPGLIGPFLGNYRYRMTGDQLRLLPLVSGATSFTLYPQGNIFAPASWTVSGATSAWDAVDDITPDGDGSYIQNTSDRNLVILDYDYPGAKMGVIQSISVKIVAKKNQSDTMRIEGVLRVNGTDYIGNWANLGTAYDTYDFSWSINPNTGQPWKWTEIKSGSPAALQGLGLRARTLPSSSLYPRVTQAYMVISVSNPTGGPYDIIVDQGMQKAQGIIDTLSSDVRFGLAFYNSGDGGHIENYVDFGSTTNMVTSIQNMVATTWTPLGETLHEMIRYFRQDSPYYSNSPADYQVGPNYDPYYFQYSKLSGSVLADQYVPCAKSFILFLTDGESTQDANMPASLQDFDNDGNDPGYVNYVANGTDFMDDVALWGRTVDQRTDLDGTQNVFLYSVFMFGKGSRLLMDAAINGGFNDLNDDNAPGPNVKEYMRDSNKNGVIDSNDLPLTYFEGNDGYELEASITTAIAEILKRAASGTAVSVLTTSSRGVGATIQSYFLPSRQEGAREVRWTGYTQNIWIDPKDNLREDTVSDSTLKLDEDQVMKLFFDESVKETKAAFFTTDDTGEGGTLATCTPVQTRNFSEASGLWEAGNMLTLMNPSSRTLFTSKNVLRGTTTAQSFTESPYPEFTATMNATLQTALNADATYTAANIVRYIRGECLETGVTGDTACGPTTDPVYRDRRLTAGGTQRVWKLGDIITSTPKVFSTTPNNTYHIDYGDNTYYKYFTGNGYKQKSAIAFIGGNDGVLHAFRVGYLKDTGLASGVKALFKNFFTSSDTDHDQLGEEVWGFIPYNAFPYLKYLARPDYCHLYYNDLSVRLVDASLDGNPTDIRTENSWKTVLIGGMRYGGGCTGGTPGPALADAGYSSYYAIDITDPENPVPLWEFSDMDLGYAASFPAILRTGSKAENGYWYVAFGSGSTTMPKALTDINRSTTGYVYILDMKTGIQVQKIPLDHNGIVGDLLSIDEEKDYVSEKIYLGTAYKDTGWKGKLASISIPNQDLADPWTPAVNYLFKDDYALTASPDAARDPSGNVWVYIGSGKYLSELDEADTGTNIFMGVKDTDPPTPFTAISLDDRTNVNVTGTVTGTSQVCLYDTTTNSFGFKTVVTSISPTSAPPAVPAVGWRIMLPGGERVITKPLAVGGLVDFLSYKPDADVCSNGGDSYLYSVDYTTGVAPTNVAITSPEITGGTTSGSVTVQKGVKLGPGAPPTGEAIIVPPPKEGQEKLKKKIQIATGVIVEAENETTFSVISKVMHWLKK